jgi:hypothetical protein
VPSPGEIGEFIRGWLEVNSPRQSMPEACQQKLVRQDSHAVKEFKLDKRVRKLKALRYWFPFTMDRCEQHYCVTREDWRLHERQLHMNLTRCVFLFLIHSLMIFMCGGCMATYSAGGEPSPDKKFYISECIVGQAGHAFDDQTKKTAYIEVYTNDEKQKTLFKKKYKLFGASLSGHWDWSTNGDFTIQFFDYGPNVSKGDGRMYSMPKNNILLVHCHYDPLKGRFFDDYSKWKWKGHPLGLAVIDKSYPSPIFHFRASHANGA